MPHVLVNLVLRELLGLKIKVYATLILGKVSEGVELGVRIQYQLIGFYDYVY